MFSFVKEKKAAAALEALASSTPLSAASATPAERAAALILCNVLLIAASKRWGRPVLEAPQRLDSAAAADAVCTLAEEHQRLEAVADALDGRPKSDPAVSAYRWEVMANEIVTLTLGAGLSGDAARAMRECWKSLWSARRACDEAVRAMTTYAKAYSVDPTPSVNGKKPTEEILRKLGGTLPPMFRPASRGGRAGGARSGGGSPAASGGKSSR